MHLILPDVNVPTRVVCGPPGELSDDEFFDFCMANSDLRIERNTKGEVIIVPPAGGESDHRSLDLGAQLLSWSRREKSGTAFGATVCFLLPDRSGLTPDAAWVSSSKMASLPKLTRRRFLPLVPDFVAEVMSPSDRLNDAREKMEQWIANGVGVAWLIDADNETVFAYRPGQPVTEHKAVERLEGEGPLRGFVADFEDIWERL